MKLTFLGAAHEVTGSCTLLEFNKKRILIDCGMEQGTDIYENCEMPVSPSQIDCVLLTHAHIDHSGKLPVLTSNGFAGKIYSTDATARLCKIMLQDSAHIQEFEAEWRNRKGRRSGKDEYVPLYTVDEALAAMTHFVGCEYDEDIEIYDDMSIRFIDAGHLLGSASIEITITENGVQKVIVFSGDIGNTNQPIIKDPTYPKKADFVVMESTYGDRGHEKKVDCMSQLVPIIQKTFDRGGNVIIPSFAVGRTQELLYFIRQIKEAELIKGHDSFSVYIDSPLAVEATNIFNTSTDDFDEEALELINAGINPISFDGLRIAVDPEESKLINSDKEPKIIISASGMCEAGRIRHHLKHNLWRPECTIVFVGYQALGTLGRALVEGVKEVKLFGESIQVAADIQIITGISGHADNNGLIKWISSFEEKPRQVFVNHGDDIVCEIFASRLRDELKIKAVAPYNGAEYDLTRNVCVYEGNKQKIQKSEGFKQNTARLSPVYQRLINAGKRLEIVIRHNEGGANKDLAKFADQIIALCDKWDR